MPDVNTDPTNPANLNVLPVGDEDAALDRITIWSADRQALYSITLGRVTSGVATANIAVRDEGTTIVTGGVLNFTGAGVSVSDVSGVATVDIPGGGGGGGGTTNASDLTSGTLPDGRFPATLPAVSGVALTSLNATNLTSGTIPGARFPATLPAVSGALLTNLPPGSLIIKEDGVNVTTNAVSLNFSGANVTDAGSGAITIAGRDTFMGAWSGATTYNPGETVSRLGSSYIHDGASTSLNEAPESTPAVWAIVAAKGDAGAAGAAGATGSAGASGFGTVQTPTISSGTLTVSYDTGNIANVSLNANITTFTETTWPATGNFARRIYYFTADGTARTIAWPAAWKWDGGTAPTPPSVSGRIMIIHATTINGGTAVQAMLAAQSIQ